jgi:hypothetical protein
MLGLPTFGLNIYSCSLSSAPLLFPGSRLAPATGAQVPGPAPVKPAFSLVDLQLFPSRLRKQQYGKNHDEVGGHGKY